MPKKQKPATKTWRPTVEDAKLFDELKAKLGIMNDSDVVRLGLRALAQKEKMWEPKVVSSSH